MAKKRRKGKQFLTKFENDITLLHNHRFDDEHYEEARQSLVRQYLVKDILTYSQKNYVKVLVSMIKKERRISRKSDNHFVYAIECGNAVKIGHSINPSKRLNELQTANPEKLFLRWSTRAGSTKVQAENFESRIHKDFKQFHIRGEWFDKQILDHLAPDKTTINLDRHLVWNAKRAGL